MSKFINYKSNKVYFCAGETGYTIYINMIEAILADLDGLISNPEKMWGKMLVQ